MSFVKADGTPTSAAAVRAVEAVAEKAERAADAAGRAVDGLLKSTNSFIGTLFDTSMKKEKEEEVDLPRPTVSSSSLLARDGCGGAHLRGLEAAVRAGGGKCGHADGKKKKGEWPCPRDCFVSA